MAPGLRAPEEGEMSGKLKVDRARLIVTLLSCLAITYGARAASPEERAKGVSISSSPLVGAWTLVRCDNVYTDGRRVELYGHDPEGLWLIDARGNYMMSIVRSQRDHFAANDKSKGTPEEYRAAALGFNSHYGHVDVDTSGMTMHVHIDHASFPNWDGRDSRTSYILRGDELTYTVNAPSSGAGEGAKGEVVWRRQATDR
jgi:lipocalin-like protein